MPSGEVIDLSLESDEGKTAPTHLPPKAQDRASVLSEQGFINLSDELDLPPSPPLPYPVRQKRSIAGPEVFPETRRPETNLHESAHQARFRQPPSKRQKTARLADDSDPIFLTSSPHIPLEISRNNPTNLAGNVDLQDDLIDTISETHLANNPTGIQLSRRTTALLAAISGNVNPQRKRFATNKELQLSEQGPSKTKTDLSAPNYSKISVIAESRCSKPADGIDTVRKKRMTSAERDMKDKERRSTKLRKETEKEEEKERKRLEKDQKVKERQTAAALAEVNKSRTDKKVSTPEMIVDLPQSIEGQSVDTQIRELLRNLQVQITKQETPIPNIIRWRRKVTARFNEELGHWERMPDSVELESHIMCLLSAKEFVALATATGEGKEDLEHHVRKLKTTFKDCTPIYMIEGLEAWSRKAKNVKNRAYQAAVIDQLENRDASGTSNTKLAKSCKNQPVEEAVDEDLVEDALMRLQVIQGCLVHHTAASLETAEWVVSFTQHISTIPYK